MPLSLASPLILTPPADFQTLYPQVVSLARQLSLKYVHRYRVTEEDLQTLGAALWRTLESDDDLDAARHAAGTQILPLVIESAEPLLQFLPWECLHHPEHGFLGKHPGFTLSHRLEPTAPATDTLPQGPLQVLLFTALPDDLDPEQERLDVESEQANVLEALDPLIQAGKVVLTTPDDGRFSHLKERLRQQPFQLVFLSGHGTFREKEPGVETDSAWFLFEGDDGRRDPVEGKDLAQAFPGTAVQGVVLSACESGKSASDALSAGLAARLLESGLPHVVGMRESIPDIAGTRFAQALCTALGREERLDVALQKRGKPSASRSPRAKAVGGMPPKQARGN